MSLQEDPTLPAFWLEEDPTGYKNLIESNEIPDPKKPPTGIEERAYQEGWEEGFDYGFEVATENARAAVEGRREYPY